MKSQFINITLVVEDYDEAIDFYTKKLRFKLVEDTQMIETKRWVRVQPPGGNGCCLLLAKAGSDEQKQYIGNQTGGRVFLFLQTDDFYRDYNFYTENGVKVIREPSVEEYGTVAVIADLYGNLIDLIGPKT
ncbi:VOC family protein [Fulvivirga sp. RKSG066]|uniref:VOC family protein n=1 Tax=Fulvivirga aurantia TaxID=2529383 RepID=UPI0012BC2378|nr:VOC family protein [Fulvivirga aurantia]MTI20511.1 VOC family protein [Fulvivirga aurantia]